MKLNATAALAFCVKVPESARSLLEGTTVLHEFNKANHSRLGYSLLGSFGDEELHLTAFYVSAEPLDPTEVDVVAIGRGDVRLWKKDLQKFLREQEIQPLNEIRFRLLAGLDN